MALKTAAVNRSQNATNQSTTAFEKVAKQLKECDGLIGQGEEAKKKAVKIVNDYLATVRRGEKDKVRNALCVKAQLTNTLNNLHADQGRLSTWKYV